MKKILLALLYLASMQINALSYDVQFENEHVIVAHITIDPQEKIDLHRDEYHEVVLALQEGTITRIEADGSENPVNFPERVGVVRPADPQGELHKSENRSDKEIELIAVMFKTADEIKNDQP